MDCKKMIKKSIYQEGYTLVEVILIGVIIGIIIVIAVPNFLSP